MIYYIYKITNLLNNQFYIGMHQTKNLNDGYFGSGLRLKYLIDKYGIENFKKEILEFLSSRDEMIQKEKELVTNDVIKSDLCLNLKPGGEGGFSNIEHQRKCHIFLSNWLKEKWKNDLEYIKDQKERSSQRMKQHHVDGKITIHSFAGKNHKEETLNQMRGKTHQQKEGNSQFGTCWITKENENKKIRKEELSTYLFQGWIKGRKINKTA